MPLLQRQLVALVRVDDSEDLIVLLPGDGHLELAQGLEELVLVDLAALVAVARAEDCLGLRDELGALHHPVVDGVQGHDTCAEFLQRRAESREVMASAKAIQGHHMGLTFGPSSPGASDAASAMMSATKCMTNLLSSQASTESCPVPDVVWAANHA